LLPVKSNCRDSKVHAHECMCISKTSLFSKTTDFLWPLGSKNKTKIWKETLEVGNFGSPSPTLSQLQITFPRTVPVSCYYFSYLLILLSSFLKTLNTLKQMKVWYKPNRDVLMNFLMEIPAVFYTNLKFPNGNSIDFFSFHFL